MKKKKLLITGATGFVGQNILRALQGRDDFEIYHLGKSSVADSSVKNIFCDAENFDFSSVDEQFDYIIHLLALSNNTYCSPLSYAKKLNIEFTEKVLAFALTQKNLKKFIHLSSIITYDNRTVPPVNEDGKLYLNYNTYCFTKGVAENHANYYREVLKMPMIIFRLSNIYGPYQRIKNSPFLIPSKIVQGIDEKKIEVASFTPKRDWIYSEDAAKAIVKGLDSSFSGILNLGTGKGSSVGEIMKIISEELGVPCSERKEPTTGPIDFYCDVGAIEKELGWKPETDLREGLQKTIAYIRKNK